MAVYGVGRAAVASFLAALVLVGCGGGTSQTAQQNAVTSKSVAATVVTQTTGGAAATRFAEGERFDAVVRVEERTRVTIGDRVQSDTTAPLANARVELEATGASVLPASGSQLTDSQGRAVFRLTAGDVAGAFGIRASVVGAANPVAVEAPFAVDRTVQPRLSLVITDASGSPVASARPGDELRVALVAERARVNAIGVEQQLEPAANVRIELSTESGRFDPSGSQVITDAAGQADAIYIPGLVNGRVRVTASAVIEDKTVTAVRAIDVRVPQVRIGFGMPFRAGLRVDPPEIESGAEARITAQLLREDGVLFDQPLEVTFSSACVAAGASTVLSPTLSAGGEISTVYNADGCIGVDRIRASVQIPGLDVPAIAEGTIRIRAPLAEGIAFVKAEPADIALRGRATPERPDVSRVSFLVRNAVGVPVPGAQVAFALTGQIGDTTLQSPSAISNNDGVATAVVRAGDSAAVVSVQATVVGTAFSTVSRQITVSTGGADQDSFSLSVQTFNIEAANIDGVTTTITARAADRFNNPVADGTRVLFTTSGGAIPASCATSGGVCSVQLVSQNPRPANGRVAVLARTEGSESFVDLNGNGVWDIGEPFEDLGEAFLDVNENGRWDAGEFFADLNGNGRWDGPNGRFDGGPCAQPAACGLATDVRGSAVVVFSTSSASIQIVPSAIALDDFNVSTVRVLISDRNGNLPPAGSSIEITTSNGQIIGDVGGEIGNSNARGPFVVEVPMIGDGEPSTGLLSVRVTSPAGVVSNATATVSDVSLCDGPTFGPRPPQCDSGDSAPASVELTPATVNVSAGSTFEQNVTVRVRSGATPPGPVQGVTPAVTCASGNGVAAELVSTPQPTAANGETVIRVRATASASAEGDTVCEVRAGTATASLRIAGPPAGANTVGSILLAPAEVLIQPNDSNRPVTVLATVRSASAPAVAVAGVTPSVSCTTAGAVGMVINPGIVAPTDASGRTDIPLFLTADAAPAGSAVCQVTAGPVVQQITIRP